MTKKLLGLLLVVLLLVCPLSVGALSTNSVPYTTYDYNFYEESISAPAGYVPDVLVTAEALGLEEKFNTPTDIYYDNEGTLYLLDSGNGRMILMNSDFTLKEVWDNFVDQNGDELDFTGAEGMAIGYDKRIYIADTQNQRILVFGTDRVLEMEILSPEDEAHSMEEGLPFDVNKVMVDNRRNLYALSRSNNMGAFVFNEKGEYVRFFGGNQVQQTAEVVMKYLLRPFLTQEQLEGMTTSTPINIASFDVDDEGFVYTCTAVANTTTVPAGIIRKLNYLGKNILDDELIFGDLEWDRKSTGKSEVTNFIDLDVDSKGFINMLDGGGRHKVFQYNERGELIAVFGSKGTQFGTFDDPCSVESVGDKVVVVDKKKNSLTVFRPTAYGEKYRDAIVKLENDDFSGSLEIWESLQKENSNNAHTYYGMGRVYDMKAQDNEIVKAGESLKYFKMAMDNFKLAGDRGAYSESFQEYRNELIKQWFVPILCLIVAAYVALKVVGYLRSKKAKTVSDSAYSKLESKYTFPFYTLFHPADGFQQLKPRKIGSWRVVGVILLSLFVVFTLQFFLTGYIFNLNRAVDYSLLIMVLKTIGIACLFILSNWAVCTLFNGNGNLKEIACVTAYSLLPFIFAMIINVIASNFLSGSEGAIMNILLVVGILWSFLLLICGLSAIHEYNMTQTLFSTIATVIGMAVITFLLIMFFSLMQQTASFFQSIITEALSR